MYGCIVEAKDYAVRKDGTPFSMEDYKNNPGDYVSTFHETIAPYARMIINGIFWDERYPRLLTSEQTKDLMLQDKLRLLALADISCDIGGSMEFMNKASSISDPFYLYDPITGESHKR